MRDRHLLLAASFLRALATGMVGVLIGIYLARRGLDAAEIGLVVGVGLAGAAAAALAATLLGDRLGRRRTLLVLAVLGAATRQSYVMALVRPEERTFAAGITHLVRLGAWAVAPAFAGLLMRGTSLAVPLYVGAGMKIAYDLLLYASFRGLRPPEEAARSSQDQP